MRGLHVFTANNSTGTLTNAYGIFTKSINNIGAGSVGNAYGLYVDAACNTGGGAVANNYGVFIEDNSTVGTSSFNLYSKGNDSKNYFAGSVGIGTTAPAAKLEINKSIPDGTNQSLLVLTAQGGGYNHGSSIDFRNTASGYYAGIAAVDDAQYDGRIEFRVSNNGVTNSSPLTTADAAMTILRTGNVGIGTTTPKSDLEVIGSVGHSIMTTSGSLTLNATHHTVIITGTHTITLPAANSCTNRVYIIVNNSGGTRTISSYINIGGSSTTSISSSTSITIQSNGTSWYRIK